MSEQHEATELEAVEGELDAGSAALTHEAHERLAVVLSETGGDFEAAREAAGLGRSAAYRALTLQQVRERIEALERAKDPVRRLNALQVLDSIALSGPPGAAVMAAKALLSYLDSREDRGRPSGSTGRRRRLVIGIE